MKRKSHIYTLCSSQFLISSELPQNFQLSPQSSFVPTVGPSIFANPPSISQSFMICLNETRHYKVVQSILWWLFSRVCAVRKTLYEYKDPNSARSTCASLILCKSVNSQETASSGTFAINVVVNPNKLSPQNGHTKNYGDYPRCCFSSSKIYGVYFILTTSSTYRICY